MTSRTAGGAVVTVALLLGGVIVVGNMIANSRDDDTPVATPVAAECPASDDGVYMLQFMQDWFNDTYPGVERMPYDQWLEMTSVAYDVGEAEVRRLWATETCDDLHLADDTVEGFVFAIPHDEAPSTPSTGGGGGDLPDVDAPHVRSPFYCSWSFRGGVNCGVRG